jgi:hypothetical protein
MNHNTAMQRLASYMVTGPWELILRLRKSASLTDEEKTTTPDMVIFRTPPQAILVRVDKRLRNLLQECVTGELDDEWDGVIDLDMPAPDSLITEISGHQESQLRLAFNAGAFGDAKVMKFIDELELPSPPVKRSAPTEPAHGAADSEGTFTASLLERLPNCRSKIARGVSLSTLTPQLLDARGKPVKVEVPDAPTIPAKLTGVSFLKELEKSKSSVAKFRTRSMMRGDPEEIIVVDVRDSLLRHYTTLADTILLHYSMESFTTVEELFARVMDYCLNKVEKRNNILREWEETTFATLRDKMEELRVVMSLCRHASVKEAVDAISKTIRGRVPLEQGMDAVLDNLRSRDKPLDLHELITKIEELDEKYPEATKVHEVKIHRGEQRSTGLAAWRSLPFSKRFFKTSDDCLKCGMPQALHTTSACRTRCKTCLGTHETGEPHIELCSKCSSWHASGDPCRVACVRCNKKHNPKLPCRM